MAYVQWQSDNTDNKGIITDEDLWKSGDIVSIKLDPKARNKGIGIAVQDISIAYDIKYRFQVVMMDTFEIF